MNIILVGINSKYVHTNLAIRKIKAYLNASGLDAGIKEYSGGEEVMRVAADILLGKPDAVGFSCYIWNIEYVLKLADIIKKADKNIKIIFGGPEAQYNAEKLFETHDFIDAICCGEGEGIYKKILTEGLNEKMYFGEDINMDEMPFPYSDEDLAETGRIFYYESSRGCPFSCVYCLSSAQRGIKYRSLPKVFADLDIFAKNNVRLVKFVDRTFNSDLKRSKEILKYILNLDCKTEFHAEIAADIMDDEFIEILKAFPENKIRLEAGLQSANPKVLEICGRKSNLEKLEKNIKRIENETNATVHLDLIAGLPGEDLESFKNSFNFAIGMQTAELQLGFLKVLPGTPIEKMAEEYEIVYSKNPPYEIISGGCISFEELAQLKNVELVLDYYYNSGIAKNSMEILFKKFPSAYDFFDKLAQYFVKNGLNKTPHHRVKLFEYLYMFADETGIADMDFRVALCRDYFLGCTGAPFPMWAEAYDVPLKKEKIHEILTDDGAISGCGKLIDVPPKDRHKHVKIEKLYNMVWLVSNIDKKIVDITSQFE